MNAPGWVSPLGMTAVWDWIILNCRGGGLSWSLYGVEQHLWLSPPLCQEHPLAPSGATTSITRFFQCAWRTDLALVEDPWSGPWKTPVSEEVGLEL